MFLAQVQVLALPPVCTSVPAGLRVTTGALNLAPHSLGWGRGLCGWGLDPHRRHQYEDEHPHPHSGPTCTN